MSSFKGFAALLSSVEGQQPAQASLAEFRHLLGRSGQEQHIPAPEPVLHGVLTLKVGALK